MIDFDIIVIHFLGKISEVYPIKLCIRAFLESYMEIEDKKYDIYNIPDNFDKINALLEKYKLSKAIEKLP